MKRALLFIILLAAGLVLFVPGLPYYDLLPTNGSPVYMGVLSAGLLLLSLGLKWWATNQNYWRAAYALFIAAAALLSLVLGPFNFLITATDPFVNIAQDKLAQALAIIPPILILTLVARQNLGSIYLQRGRPRQWLRFGLIGFAVFAAIAVIVVIVVGLDPVDLLPAVPWILLWAIANSLMEELWFRGIFLRPYEPLVGRWGAVLVTALVFGATHVNATYVSPALQLGFGALAALLGAAAAVNMQRSDSIWGAVLFHAGYDLVIILPVVESVQLG